jgi:hypothetical protein
MNNELPRLKYYHHRSIDKIRWDQCISRSKNGLIYALSWYLDAVTEEKWDALISDDFEWVMPLPLKKKAGITYLPTPAFVQQLGIFGPGPFSTDLTDHFCKHIEANVKLTDYHLNYANYPTSLPGFINKERNNLILELPTERDQLMSLFNENTTRNIRKAEKSAISLSTGSIRSIINLFMQNKGQDVPHWKIDTYNTLERLYNMCMMRKSGVSLGAYNASGELIAGAFFLQWNGRATFIFSGNSEQGKEAGALSALIYKYMMEAPPDIRIFDFEGSDNQGLARYYGGFGASHSNYVHLKQNKLPLLVKWLKKSS